MNGLLTRYQGWRLVLGLSMCSMLGACATIQQQSYLMVESQLRNGQTEAALHTLEQDQSISQSSALYHLNKAMILRDLGRYEDSVVSFEDAKKVIGRFDATSVSQALASYTMTEQFNNYQAPMFEQLFLHIYQIMNFLALNKPDDARVEALQIDAALKKLSEEGLYREAATARYVSGLVFEALYEIDSALVAYQQARDNYINGKLAMPDDLRERIQLLSDRLGVDVELDSEPESALASAIEYVGDTAAKVAEPSSPSANASTEESEANLNSSAELVPPPGAAIGEAVAVSRKRIHPVEDLSTPHGQLVIFADNDFAPVKYQNSTTALDRRSGEMVRISLPSYLERHLSSQYWRFEVSGHPMESEVFADIENMAVSELDRQMPKLTLRAISRVVSKAALTRKANKENEMLGAFVNLMGAVLEQADTRNWRTLPNIMHIATLRLPPGQYDVDAFLNLNPASSVKVKTVPSIQIQENGITFVNLTWRKPGVGYRIQ